MRTSVRRRTAAFWLAVTVPLAAAGVVALSTPDAQALDNGVARTPPMGWNSWNTFFCNINESLIRGMADSIVSSGMRDAGYNYVVVDDCWMRSTRDSGGNLVADPTRFPSGMKALGDYLHARNLKFGLYQAPLDKTCAQYFGSYPGATGSLNHEQQDARSFASWGVDYLKYDWCSPSGSINDQVTTFAKMRDALRATGRPIVYSINSNSIHSKTGPQRDWGDVANMWRTTEDIQLVWKTDQQNGYPMGIQNIIDVNVPLARYARPGAFTDPDMMEVGRGTLTDTEQRSHFAMWAIMASPLIAGNDIRNQSAATKAILTNRRLLDINQDPLALQGSQVSNDGTRRILAKKLANGDVAVALFNQGTSTTTISTTAAAIGLSGSSFTLTEAWNGTVTSSTGAISASVPGHGTVVYRVSGAGTPSSPPVSASPSATSASPSVSPSVPVSPSVTPSSTGPVPTGSCQVTYKVTGQWTGGFQGDVTIRNTGTTPINGWTLTWSFGAGQKISQAWGATATQSGSEVSATNVSWNGSIAPGATATLGFLGDWNGSNPSPSAFALNQSPCSLG